MKIDMHCHVIGNGRNIHDVDNDVYLYAEDNQLLFTRMLACLIQEDLERMEADLNRDGMISTDEYFALLYRMLSSSAETDGIVLLGLDAVYSPETGDLDEEKTDLWVSNRFLARKVEELNSRLRSEGIEKTFYLGASVSPNRRDWEAELAYVLDETDAVLIKWIPSTQHIDVRDEKYRDFYGALSDAKMPLLCHVGPEYSFPEGIRNTQLDYFRVLEKPLDEGVTVIAAHCASPVFPVIDRNDVADFLAFMKDANSDGTVRLWADTSALSLSTRLPILPGIVETFPPEWLIHGTDFPIPIDGWPHLPWITHDVTPEEYVNICRTKNPLDRDILIKRAHGLSDDTLTNAEKVLRLKAL
ncbi:MAG TPA: amidohydrolase family protein [Dissulfurispiraceae bacterium]|nr:amidohydrolase family protein [Dissulfurispiraceae bacterium]